MELLRNVALAVDDISFIHFEYKAAFRGSKKILGIKFSIKAKFYWEFLIIHSIQVQFGCSNVVFD